MSKIYDIEAAFERIEGILIQSMKRNLSLHKKEEILNRMEWTQWQAEQLAALKSFRLKNKELFSKEFSEIIKQTEKMLRESYQEAAEATERAFLEKYISKDNTPGKPLEGARELHEAKLEALIKETTESFQQAETAALRKADDAYRKIIFDSQVYLNTGSGTLTAAIDMAAKDFLANGLNCVQYKDGRIVNIASYGEMALRTANTRATLQGEAYKRDEWGIQLVMVIHRGTACPLCMKYLGHVFFDDVYSEVKGTSPGRYTRLSSAIKGGLYHPNCKDRHTTYFAGITKPYDMTREDQREAERRYQLEQIQRYYERQIRKYKRLEAGGIGREDVAKYTKKKLEWQKRTRDFIEKNNDVLRRDYTREKVYT